MDIADLQHLAGIRNKFMDLKKKEKAMGLKPGDKDWFKLWFSKPYMNGPTQFRGRTKK